MNIVRSRLVDNIKENFPDLYVDSTYGYVTKYNRTRLGLEKSHANDAFVVAGGQNQIRSRPYQVNQIRRNNRSLQLNRKGDKPFIKKQRYKYAPGDLIKKQLSSSMTAWGELMNKKDRKTAYTVKGVFNYGEYIRLSNPIQGENDLNIKIKDMNICKYGSGLLFQLTKTHDMLKKKDKIKKLSKKEQNIIDMKKQISIDDAWS